VAGYQQPVAQNVLDLLSDVISTIIMSSSSPPTTAAAAQEIYSFIPHSITHSPHHVPPILSLL
jgi:uncharacterized FAD-dependent dehydrogenase